MEILGSEGHGDHGRRFFRELLLWDVLSTPLGPTQGSRPTRSSVFSFPTSSHTTNTMVLSLPSLSSQGSAHTLGYGISSLDF